MTAHDVSNLNQDRLQSDTVRGHRRRLQGEGDRFDPEVFHPIRCRLTLIHDLAPSVYPIS